MCLLVLVCVGVSLPVFMQTQKHTPGLQLEAFPVRAPAAFPLNSTALTAAEEEFSHTNDDFHRCRLYLKMRFKFYFLSSRQLFSAATCTQAHTFTRAATQETNAYLFTYVFCFFLSLSGACRGNRSKRVRKARQSERRKTNY